MKNKILFLTTVLLLTCIFGCNREKANDSTDDANATAVLSSPDLNDITSKWVSTYQSLYPDANIQIVDVPESSLQEYIENNRSIGFLSEEYAKGIYADITWKETVGREIIVPFISENNPFVDKIEQRGISISELSKLISDPSKLNWGLIDEAWSTTPLRVYVDADSKTSAGLSRLFEVDQVDYSHATVISRDKIVSSVKSDPGSIGLCYLNEIIDESNNDLISGIKLLPIDRNENGRLDYMENFYGSLAAFSRGVWIGKYPGVLSNNIISVSSKMLAGETEKSFMRWVLTDGQQYLNNSGFSYLMANERMAKVNMLNEPQTINVASETYSMAKHPVSFYIYLPIIMAAFLLLYIIVHHAVIYIKEKRALVPGLMSSGEGLLNNNLIESPEGLFYDKTHTWAFMEKDGLVKIGIDDFLQHITGPITGIKMKKAGERVRKGSQILSISQNGKQLDIYAGVSGTIKELNEKLAKNASALNSSPYGEGWIYKIEPSNWVKEIQFMIMGSGYREWLKNEFTRFKEFLTIAMKSSNVEYARILQDGGEIKDGILKDFGPRIWDDFQSNFIDISV